MIALKAIVDNQIRCRFAFILDILDILDANFSPPPEYLQ